MARLAPGELLGERFEIIGPLGRGGTATVWLANDRVRGEQVALKVLHEHLSHDPSMRRRLRQEVQATARLDAQGALVCHDLHDVDGFLAVSMPYHPGRTLTEVVATDGPLDADAVRGLGVRVGSALSQAHQRGVLHRDVTPNNLMLDDGAAVLTDFGLATTHDGGTRTATSVMGTPGYAAPEVWHGVRRDPRSDLYGLGATLYFAATGKPPFAGGSPGETLTAQLSGGLPPLAEQRPDLPADLVETISGLLAAQPNHRLQSASEVVESLETGVATRPIPETWRAPETTRSSQASPSALPKGPWTVVLRSASWDSRWGGRRRGKKTRDAERLTNGLARLVGVPAAQLEPPRALGSRRVRLVKGVDRATAERLQEMAEAAGYRAKLFNEGPAGMLEQLAKFFWLPIPIMWVFFAFSATFGYNPARLLPMFIIATILLSTVSAPFRRNRIREGTPLAFPRDLGLALPEPTGDPVSHATPTSVEEASQVVDEPRSSETSIATPALEALAALDQAIEQADDLPEIARSDLRSTARDLRERLQQLSDESAALERELGTPAPDVSWAAQRLERLETLERAGKSVSEEERRQLIDAIEAHGAAQEQAAGLESQLTMLRAAVLEVAATARRARQSLLQHAGHADTARGLVDRLARQADAADRARREARSLGARVQR